jgi:hypothetical protein
MVPPSAQSTIATSIGQAALGKPVMRFSDRSFVNMAKSDARSEPDV